MRVRNLHMNKTIPAVIGVAIVSLAAGALLGYHYAKNDLQEEFDIKVEDEIEELRRSYARRYKKGDLETVEKAAESLIPATRGPRSGVDIPAGRPFEQPPIETEKLEEIVQRLKYDAKTEEPWVAQASALEPNPDVSGPFVIPVEVFVANELDHYQPTWNYYESDDILVDEGGNIVDDRDEIIGKGTLKCFGQGSNDIDLVYVRNTDLSRDYEITRIHGNYLELVEGEVSPKKQRHGNRAKA